MKRLILIISIFLFNFSFGQSLIDRHNKVEQIEQTVHYIYNFQFDQAEILINKLEETIDTYPGLYLLKSLKLYWEQYPLQEDSEYYLEYENLLMETADRARELLDKDPNDVEGIFFSLAAYGYLTNYHAEKGNLLKTISYAKNAYKYLKNGFDLKEKYVEFYFTTGLYNYYREKYPENHPVYKPFLWFFQSGNKSTGIEQLDKAADEATFTKVEALYYLFHINLRYKTDPSSALNYVQLLIQQYPDNLVFQVYHAENLLILQQFSEVIPIVERLKEKKNKFYEMTGLLFNGVIQEKLNKNYHAAINFYERAIKVAGNSSFDSDHYLSMAYTGLARCADQLGNIEQAKDYYKKALNYSSYDIIIDEAKAYLDNLH